MTFYMVTLGDETYDFTSYEDVLYFLGEHNRSGDRVVTIVPLATTHAIQLVESCYPK